MGRVRTTDSISKNILSCLQWFLQDILPSCDVTLSPFKTTDSISIKVANFLSIREINVNQSKVFYTKHHTNISSTYQII